MGRARSEFDVIAALFAPLSKNAPGAFDLKDDAAAFDVGAGHEAVITVDTVIESVHFLPDDPPDLVARKALRVNLSDLAAKGATPVGFLQALSVNSAVTDDYLAQYAKGLAADVAHFGIPLLGGDTTSGPGPLAVSITAIGSVRKGAMIRRGGARAGDVLCVTGTIGDAALGLDLLRGKLKVASRVNAVHLVARYRLPEPRLSAGAALAGRAGACLDISDGLVADIGHICAASGVAALIERDKIPLSNAARAAVTLEPEHWPRVFGGGDDYELAFTLPAPHAADLPRLAEEAGVPMTVIGRIVGADDAKLGSVTVLDGAGHPVEVPVGGYLHR
ncbi:MAG: thiamine-phosphate kinase [Proteobacteria bacterium]|nr:thiamine-phosphate kinase [Pseudomonadota bacterium]